MTNEEAFELARTLQDMVDGIYREPDRLRNVSVQEINKCMEALVTKVKINRIFIS